MAQLPQTGFQAHAVPGMQLGEIAVLPKSCRFTPQHVQPHQAVMRWGFGLELMYAVTDYFAQGETFSALQSWLV
ncbi:hypothetical protein GPECTOR_378g175 [Gonium pectorale]|uniref:Uncharacterized protein n=1 Tax=Gonium pectorale TaxID=33097 RepID=A0A150FVG1_GONPE|nr:hypothetical protein GPECTOR_378g175 [Gonium pectorale]|eukprot:KXZ41586.1 hypothetical protein GPECTOR_378g175 [Gonium pectorale]